MRYLIAAALTVMLALPVAAQDYQKGDVAYQRGDYATALREWRPLAEQGHAAAQYNLGGMYSQGQGVPRDDVLSYMWLNLAASRFPPGKDRDKAVEGRDAVAERMTPAQIAEAQKLARQWWKRRKQYE